MYFLARYTFPFLLLAGGVALLMVPVAPPKTSLLEASPSAAFFSPDTSSLGENETVQSATPPPISAGAVFVYDTTTGETLFQKNSDVSFGIASITKIMTALAALGRVGEEEIIPIQKEAVDTEGNEGGLHVGEHMRLSDLVILMLVSSSNDAAVAIADYVGRLYGAPTFEEAERVFVGMMNDTAREMGLQKTHFENPTGLDIDEAAGIISNTSTAKETATFVNHALRNSLIREVYNAPSDIISEEGFSHSLIPTHTLLLGEPGVIHGKTGFTDIAGGTLVTIAEIPLGKLVILIVLDATREGRFEDTLQLINWLRTQ